MKAAIASGMSDRQATLTVPGAPSDAAWSRYLQNRPERAAEIAEVRHAKGKPSFDRIAANFDALIKLIGEGHSAVTAGRELGINGDRLTEYLLAHPQKRPAYVAAMVKRAKVLGIRSTTIKGMPRRKDFTEAEFDAALALIARSTAPDLATALRRADLPRNGSLQRRARKDPAFRGRLDRAYSAHGASTHYLRYIKDPTEPRMLLASLLADKDFAAGFNRFKSQRYDRHDLAQEYCLAVLEGRLSKADLKKNKAMNDIRKRALGNSLAFTSLDAPSHGDGDSRYSVGDTIASPCGIHTY
ncbi:hypothetical protein Nham_0341 [Nitrobacter hamburgensis X14]|uniref:Uncharacterized protein n=1 Tax=Nitrobacter hamburgensis (strain DSM 10229 / NCIMB 13809 / X14) TaxID=323097 RepID=Q1QRB0_NITHX|nr:hypothetical protein [Nitrobacter hamburgensis]ABE61237.1 hypothetical protein Nham_0341 [Nitrobacter hamburgensis X14]